MMADVASAVVVPALREAGVEARIETYPSDGKTLYQSFVSPMGWTIRGGELWVEGETPERLCRYSDVPMCVSTYSRGGSWPASSSGAWPKRPRSCRARGSPPDGSLVAPATPPGGAPATAPATRAATTGPRRLVIPPVEPGFFEKLTGEDRTWYEEQKQKDEDFAVVIDETIRLLDGHRTTRDLADALTIELGLEIAEAWTARLLKVLARLKLVTP